MLRIYFLQQWFNLSDPAAEDAICDKVMSTSAACADYPPAPSLPGLRPVLWLARGSISLGEIRLAGWEKPPPR
jgi:IS5 family transposase